MATWFIKEEADGEKTVLFKSKDMFTSAGRCSAATPTRMVLEWVVTEAEEADVIVTSEGSFTMPFRTPTRWESRC